MSEVVPSGHGTPVCRVLYLVDMYGHQCREQFLLLRQELVWQHGGLHHGGPPDRGQSLHVRNPLVVDEVVVLPGVRESSLDPLGPVPAASHAGPAGAGVAGGEQLLDSSELNEQ